MNKEYTTKALVEAYLQTTLTQSLDNYIIAMSNYIALTTNREWLADTTATARVYNGNGKYTMQFDDFIDLTTVETGEDCGENYTEITSYTSYPFNIPSKTAVILKDDIFPIGIKTVRITAKWGYSATVPKDIEHACTILVAGVIQAQTNQEGEVESEKIGNYQVKYVTDQQKSDFKTAMDILSKRTVIRIN